jgi:hypothetical protein
MLATTGHQGKCQPSYEPGDFVRTEFPDESTGIGEWMWMQVNHPDDGKRLVFSTLDNEPLKDYSGKVKLGSQLAVGYAQAREYKKPAEFKPQN